MIAQRRQGKVLHACRGKLDREREPVQPSAEVRDGGDVLAHAEVGTHRLRPFREQRYGWTVRFQTERRHGELALSAQPQRRPARREHGQPEAARDQVRDERRRVEDVLEGVEHEQDPTVADSRLDQVGHRFVRRVRAERAGQQRGDERGVASLRQRDEAHAVGEVRPRGQQHLDGEPGLADPAGAGEREQADLRVEQAGKDRGELVLASDQAGRWHRQCGGLQLAAAQLGWRRSPMPARHSLEQRPLVACNAERRRDAGRRIAIDAIAESTLDVADGAGTDAGPLRELLLGQAGATAVPPQQRS